MNFLLSICRSKSSQATRSQPSGEGIINNSSYLPNVLLVIAEGKAFLRNLFRYSRADSRLETKVVAPVIDQSSKCFVANDTFKRGADAVALDGRLHVWRHEHNAPPMFVVLRPIGIGEEVICYPADLARSDLMPHWGRNYWLKRNENCENAKSVKEAARKRPTSQRQMPAVLDDCKAVKWKGGLARVSKAVGRLLKLQSSKVRSLKRHVKVI